MISNFNKVLADAANDPLFNGQGDDLISGKRYVINGFDALLSNAAEALVTDGISRKAIMTLFINHALEVLDKAPGVTQPMKKQNADALLQSVLDSIYDHHMQAV
jgi:hypothetical protein